MTRWQTLGIAVITAILILTASTPAKAIHPHDHSHIRSATSGGVLAESYRYHRGYQHGPSATSPPPPARYVYGFPVKTYRWGWFGATQYYPRSFSHRGYNGDHWHWAYRQGY